MTGSFNDDRLDAIIDDAARQITAGAPPAHLKARVLARVERRRSPWPWVATAAAAAAAIAIATALWSRGPSIPPRSEQPGSVVSTTTQPPAGGAAPPQASGAHPERTTIDRPSRRVLGRPVLEAVAPRRAEERNPVAAIAPAPLTLPRADVPPIQPIPASAADPIALPELEPIAPIAVAPLAGEESQRRFP